ncbi:MAG TPA: hypothetical protein VNH64_00510 [Parvularculaceae bacterium]|nr:hypothetical protein [Parvularculaceae bacterium]
MNRLARSFFALAACLIAPAFASAQEAGKTPGASQAADAYGKDVAQEVNKGWTKPPVEEQLSTTAHSISVHGKTMKYLANAGTLTIRDENAKPTASVFYVAYTLGDKPDPRRPVTFFYNGGPGSATIWLHMGSFGPMRVQTKDPVTIAPAPYDFTPNPDTLLDRSDLVFVDAVGAGYSRPLGDAKGKDFWGVDEDADAFAKAIIRYLTKFNRWDSPKFIFGESYGTTRSGALAYQLDDRGAQLNGVVILSSILNYGRRQPGYDENYISYIPTYAAAAWYHGKIANKPAKLADFVEEARKFARDVYAPALAKGDQISPEDVDSVASALSKFIGVDAEFIKDANLRIDLNSFRKELLRDERKTIGRYDARYTGIDPDASGDQPEYDPSGTAITGAFVGAFRNYIANSLNYKTDMPYLVSARIVKDFDWDWKHKAPGSNFPQLQPDVAVDLSAALRVNPHLKLLSLNGYYDMATPFFGTEYDIHHMMLEPAQSANVEFRYYPSGHMVYLNPDALHQLHADLAVWYDETLTRGRSAQGSR